MVRSWSFRIRTVSSSSRRKRDDRATICFFVGYKYDGSGYRVWDPKRRVVVESRDIAFFEDSLLSPTLNDLPPRPVDEDESVAQLVLDHSIKPTAATRHQCARTLPTVSGNAHGLARGHATARLNANTSYLHHHTPTRARDEQASCTSARA